MKQWPTVTPEQAALVDAHQGVARSWVNAWARARGLCAALADEYHAAAQSALWIAASRWDPQRGSTFWSFAQPYILGHVVNWAKTAARLTSKRRRGLERKGVSVCFLSLDAEPVNGLPAQLEDKRIGARRRQAEARLEVERLLARLAPWERKLLRQRYLEGMTLEEMSRVHGVSPEAVRQRIEGVLERLRWVAKQASGIVLVGEHP